ncbi:hypothetical protein IWX47DRAFT_361216 [Phyllosticta citricarpa]
MRVGWLPSYFISPPTRSLYLPVCLPACALLHALTSVQPARHPRFPLPTYCLPEITSLSRVGFVCWAGCRDGKRDYRILCMSERVVDCLGCGCGCCCCFCGCGGR